MEEISSSAPPQTTTTANTVSESKRKQETSLVSRVKKECFSFGVSVQEGLRYVKASIFGQAKKMAARNEKDAATAELQAEKMQVEAANEAEHKKKSIGKTM